MTGDRSSGRGPVTVTRLMESDLSTLRAASSRDIARVSGNHQRLRRHEFAPVRARSVRLEVAATNGSEQARVYEIRCYG